MQFRLVRFSLDFVGISLGIPLAAFVIQWFFGVDLSNSGTVMIPFMFAATAAGQRHVKDSGERPTTSEMWKVARLMALIGVILSLVQFIVSMVVLNSVGEVLAAIPPMFMVIIVAVLYGIGLLTCRWFLGISVNGQLKKMERKRG